MTITGNVVSSGDVQVDGTVDGDVHAENLTIGDQGTINGTVRANNLRVLGQVSGEIHAETATLLSSAKVHGDIVHDSLAIEAGAMIEGHCRRREKGGTNSALPNSRPPGKGKGSKELSAPESAAKGDAPKNGQGTGTAVSEKTANGSGA
jgi:cytoskeletal protein CcmA (bactofilin family)